MNVKDSKFLTTDAQVEGLNKECFVIMPIADPEGYDKGHFERVYKDIFIPAIQSAGFIPRRADEEKGTNLIHIEILRKLVECPLVICDLSSRNPNVLFELGIRQAFDKPVILVQEVGTPRIFDISSIRCVDYCKERIYHKVIEDQKNICDALLKTAQEWEKGTSVNSIVKLLSITKPASLPDSSETQLDPMMQVILAELSQIKEEVRNTHIPRSSNERDFMLDSNLKEYNNYEVLMHDMLKLGVADQDIVNEIRRQAKRYRMAERRTNKPDAGDLAGRFESLYQMASLLPNQLKEVD